jgi:rubrerythrin
MRFENAREALKHASIFHLELSKLYTRLLETTKDEKTRMLISYLIKQEEDLAQSLKSYEKETPSGVLDTWMQYANDANILKIPKIEALHEDASSNDILAISSQITNELLALYAQVEQQVDEDEVKEIFANLANMQSQKLKRVSMNFDRLMDI